MNLNPNGPHYTPDGWLVVRPAYEGWRPEPTRSSWPLVAIGAALVLLALWGLRL